MILMRIVTTVRQDDIGIDTPFQGLEPRFDLLALLREKSISESHYLNSRVCGVSEKVGSGSPGFTLALNSAAENTPVNIETNATVHQAQKGCSRANLNVIRMRT
jgi:hypothetical protein